MQWYLKVVRDNYGNFSGRATRQEYWMFLFINIIFSVIAAIVDNFLGTVFTFGEAPYEISLGYGWIYLLYGLIILLPAFAVTVRRLHDTDRSGWWLLINVIPIIGAIWFFILLCSDSKPETNQYGPSPKYGSLSKSSAPDEPHEIHLDSPQVSQPAETVLEQESVQTPEYLVPISLHVENGPRKGSFYAVSSNSRIGRAPDNDVALNVDTVSSYHAEIFVKDNQFFIKDMNSTNGIKVNGERVSESILEPGAKLQIGETVLSIQ